MNTIQQCNALRTPLYKSVHRKGTKAVEIPPGAVSAGTLKTLEVQLQKRKMLPQPGAGSFNPFWFLVETERNIFLWRRGCSLIQQDEFEFWVDIEALVAKRLRQLDAPDMDNPYTNPYWGQSWEEGSATENRLMLEAAAQEIHYLNAFIDAVTKILPHLSALSHVGSLLEKEMATDRTDRERVVLPVRPARQAVP